MNLTQTKHHLRPLLYFTPIVLILILVYLLIHQISPSSLPLGVVPPQASPSIPTPNPQAPLTLLTTNPILPEIKTLSSQIPIYLTFNHPIDPSSFTYQSQPLIQLTNYLSSSPTTLVIQPTPAWQFNTTYQLTITSLRSTSNHILSHPINLEFRLQKPSQQEQEDNFNYGPGQDI